MDENQNIELTPRKFIKTLSIIHLALGAGIILFSIVSFMQNDIQELTFDFENDMLILLVSVAAVGGVIASVFISNKMIHELSNLDSLRKKLTGYQTASIIRYALIEGPALFSVVQYMETANLFYLIISGLLVLYYLTLTPSKSKIDVDLNLNHEMQSLFNQMDIVIK